MFKKMLQATSLGRVAASVEEANATPSGLSSPTFSDRDRNESFPKAIAAKLPSFEEIYRKSTVKSTTATAEYTILKVADHGRVTTAMDENVPQVR